MNTAPPPDAVHFDAVHFDAVRFDAVVGRIRPHRSARPRSGRARPAPHLRDVGHPVVLAGLTSAAVVFFVLFRTGMFLASGDVSPLVVDGLRSELGWQWTHQNTGAGGPTYEIARAVEVAAVEVARWMGGTEALGQRLLFCVIWGLTAAAGAALSCRFTSRRFLAAAVGLSIAFNPYTLIAQPNPLPLIAIGVAAALTALTVDAARGHRPRWVLLALLTLPCSYLSLNPPLLALLAALAFAQPLITPILAGVGWVGTRRVLGLYARAAPLAAGLAAWWAVPAFIAISHADPTAIGAVTNVDAWSWTHARSSLANVLTLFGHWSWPRPEYYGDAIAIERIPWSLLRWVAPLGAMSAPLFCRNRRRSAAVVFVLVAAAVVVGKGVHEPWSGLNRWMYAHVAGFWLFREPAAKVGVVLLVFYVIGFTMTLDALLARFEGRHGTPFAAFAVPAVGLIVAVAPLVGVWPLWTGAVIKPATDTRAGDRVALPAAWREVAAVVNGSHQRGKALVLPIDDYYQIPTTWGFYGADNLVRRLLTRPVIQSNPQLYIGDADAFESLMRSAEQTIALNDGRRADSLLRALGVSHIVVRKDVDFASGIRTLRMQRPEAILAGLSRTAGVRRIASTDVADVFELVEDPGVAVQVIGGIVTSGDLPPVGLGLLRSSLPTGLALASSTRVPGLVVGRALVQPASSATSTADLGAFGQWTVSRHAVSSPAVLVRVVGENVRADELVTWRIGGRQVLKQQGIDVRVAGLVGVSVGDRFVEPGAGGAVVRVDAASVAVPWTRAFGESSFGDRSDVLDCNNHDTSSPETLGLAVQDVGHGAGSEIELRTLRHSACVRMPIRGVHPGATFHVRIEGRSVLGAAPRFCIWMHGPDRCAPIDDVGSVDGERLSASAVWRVPVGTTAADLYLYADSDGVETITRYRRPVIEAVRRGAPVPLLASPPEPAPMELAAGPQPISAKLGVTPPVVGGFGPLGDCDRNDDRSPRETGISRDVVDGGVRLQARAHAACVSVHITGMAPALPYSVSFQHRTLAGDRARYCLFDPGVGACLAGGRLESSGARWATQTIAVDAPSGRTTRPLWLYVYADGSSDPGTVTEYRDVVVTPAVDEYLTLLSRGTSARTAPAMSFHEISPARYRVTITGATAPFVVALSDSWSPDWHIIGAPAGTMIDHLRIDGYRNGWAVDARGDLDLLIEYVPARAGQLAIRVSLVAVLAAAAMGWFGRSRRRAFPSFGPAGNCC